MKINGQHWLAYIRLENACKYQGFPSSGNSRVSERHGWNIDTLADLAEVILTID